MCNEKNRSEAKAAGLYLWQVAERYGVSDFTFSRKLRRELPAQEQEKIMGIIQDLSAEQKEVT